MAIRIPTNHTGCTCNGVGMGTAEEPFCTSDEIVYRLCYALLISRTSDFNTPAPFRG